MGFFLKPSESVISTAGLRSSLCTILAGWILLTSVGLSLNESLTASKANCQCDLQARRSQNCCCNPTSKQKTLSCCSHTGDEESSPPKGEDRPQWNSYCGLPASNGILIDREPRLPETNWNVPLELTVLELLPLLNDEAIVHHLCIELPPPEFATC